MMKQIRTKSDKDFILKVMSVFEGFGYKGKKYLSYMETRSRGDEFLIRDNIVKPFFTDVLGYDKQKDFAPEENIETGKPDIQIIDPTGNPVVVIETLSSGADERQFEEHRKRLFDYTDELGSKIAVLTNGIVFNAYHNRGRGKAKDRLVLLKFDEIYKKFVLKGSEGLDPVDWERLLTLKYLVKELQVIDPEQLYKEPEFDISEETHFSKFLEQLINLMAQVKMDVKNQFELYISKNEEYEELRKNRERNGRPIYPSEIRQYEFPRRCVQSFEKWQSISSVNREHEAFQLETMYIFFNRILLLRICEDKGIIKKRRISNGGIQDWVTFKGFTRFSEVNYNEMVKDAYKVMEKTYPHLFREDIFDWYMPNNDLLLKVLFTFNPYNFKQVDRDILGNLYERYIPREERKKLGQFYTPEEVINYILDAVGYREDTDIEGKRLLDPACGSGGFLVRATNILVQRLMARGFDAETILNKVRESIYGFEINPFACHLTETNLLFQVIDLIKEAKRENLEFEMGKFNVFETDSLRIPMKEKPELFKEYNSEWFEDAEIVRQIKLKEGKFKDGFDFVVGNPPYVTVWGIDSETKNYLREHFETAKGRFNTFSVFLERGILFLEQGKVLGFVVPQGLLTHEEYKFVRRFILETCQVNNLTLLPYGTFEAAVETLVIVAKREYNKEIRSQHRLAVSVSTKKGFESYKIAQEVFEHNPLQQFSVFVTPDLEKIFKKIQENSNPFGNLVEIQQGIIYSGKSKEEVFANTPVAPEYKPILDGRDINRYIINWDLKKENRYLRYSKDLHRAREERLFLAKEKILIPRKSTSIVAAYDNEQFYALNAVYLVLPTVKGYSLKYLLALLNSKLLGNFYEKK